MAPPPPLELARGERGHHADSSRRHPAPVSSPAVLLASLLLSPFSLTCRTTTAAAGDRRRHGFAPSRRHSRPWSTTPLDVADRQPDPVPPRSAIIVYPRSLPDPAHRSPPRCSPEF